jgi:hypothetical protein
MTNPVALPVIPAISTPGITQLDIARVMAELTHWAKTMGNTLVDLDDELASAPDVSTSDQTLAFVVWTAADAVISAAASSVVPNTANAPFRGDKHREALASLWKPVVGLDSATYASNIAEAMAIVESLLVSVRKALGERAAAGASRNALVEHLVVIRTLSKRLDMGASELSSIEAASASVTATTSAAQIAEITSRAVRLRTQLEGAVDERSTLIVSLENEPALLAELRALEARARELSALTTEKFTNPPRLGIPSVDALGPTPALPDVDGQPWPAVRVDLAKRAQKLSRVKQSFTVIIDKHQQMIDERLSLRGLVDSYRAKAMASRVGEQPAISAAYTAARELLWSAPCDLDSARIAAAEYIRLAGGQPPAAPANASPPALSTPALSTPPISQGRAQ